MAQLDVVIRGGTVVDGTGVPRYQADVGIKDGRVARISGRIRGGGAREIDALGCIATT
jgi:N-acyl-D-aspartate/D-glutamate deacylase